MKKYAMVAINQKELGDGVHIRRVLVSYKFKRKNRDGITTYYGTKFVAADPYFSKRGASHKYILKDGYYQLDQVASDHELAFLYAMKPDLYKKRRYHSIPGLENEFEADSKQVAVHKFKVRKELK